MLMNKDDKIKNKTLIARKKFILSNLCFSQEYKDSLTLDNILMELASLKY